MRIKPVYCLVSADGKQIFSGAPPDRPDDEELSIFRTEGSELVHWGLILRAGKEGDYTVGKFTDSEDLRNFFTFNEQSYVRLDRETMTVGAMLEKLIDEAPAAGE
jgi:hypothetical protein